MPDTTQRTFISNWNKVAKTLSKDKVFKKLPHGLPHGGCCGFSFVLAEYVKLGRAEQFYNLYDYVCLNKPEAVVGFLRKYYKDSHEVGISIEEKKCRRFALELLDFVFKVFILSSKQSEAQLSNNNETANDTWLRYVISSNNHQRIGNELRNDIHNVGMTQNSITLSYFSAILNNLSSNESFEIGLYDKSFGAHSILAYRLDHGFEIFDTNIGQRVTADNSKKAVSAVVYSLNKNITAGSNKYTLLDKLWNNHRSFRVGLCIFFPVALPWLIYDVFIAKEIPEDQLKKEPITQTAWFSWGKIHKTPDSTSTNHLYKKLIVKSMQIDPFEKNITNEELEVIDRNYLIYKNSLSKKNRDKKTVIEDMQFTETVRKSLDKVSPQERFNIAQKFITHHQQAFFSQILKQAIPALDRETTIQQTSIRTSVSK